MSTYVRSPDSWAADLVVWGRWSEVGGSAGGGRGVWGFHSPQCRMIFSITSACGGSIKATTFNSHWALSANIRMAEAVPSIVGSLVE